MCATFTDDDVGKRVETASGDTLGTVTMTEAETAYVDANDRARDTIRAILEWDDDEEIVPMDADAVGEITPDVIRLVDDRSSPDEPDAAGTDPVVERHERTDVRADSDEQRTLGTEPGDPGHPAETEEGRAGEGTGTTTEEMTEAGEERHPDMEDAPPEGERTVTDERGESEDR